MGGFKGDESTSGERDTSLNPTILSGDIGVVDDSIDNSFQKLVLSECFENSHATYPNQAFHKTLLY